ncbi:hypothetical protein LZU96_08565 [Pantoea agglomerans]|uniref:hypothetical protein n=1 Tax=Pantoea TaxID=53335 RepID=UPI001F31D302|nr:MULTISPECIES: hypothetical protein [Pantoea]UIL53963.1 hypothetical protein LZU96_08565 [Pantoea agglomerans]
MTEEQKQALIGLCKIEIKRWKAASESDPNMRYMVELMVVALSALTAEPVADVVSWNHPVENRTCAVQLRRFDLLPGELFTAPPAPAAHLAGQVPDGWKLVPVEPTEEMIIEGFESRPDESFSEPAVWKKYSQLSGCQQAAYKAQLCWAAMLAAAPEVE